MNDKTRTYQLLFCFTFLSTTIMACCFGNKKCVQDDNAGIFRIVSNTNGQDLVFGATRRYHQDSIQFFSVLGTDTIFHRYGAGSNPNPGQDSLLYVNFDYRNLEEVFVRLSHTDIDTLQVAYNRVDGSPCCEDFIAAKPNAYNNKTIEVINGGIRLLRK